MTKHEKNTTMSNKYKTLWYFVLFKGVLIRSINRQPV
jgi:hypothetical protein